MLSPRFCVEDISYLEITDIKKIAYPMKCFCDINLHRLDVHLKWYGHYGLAFTKEWGMKNKIQPIQYINPDSELRKDFTTEFNAALSTEDDDASSQTKMKNFLLHQMMYYKPYEGEMKNRLTKLNERNCYTDECEWRFIPDVTVAGFEQAYYDQDIFNAGIIGEINNTLNGLSDVSLKFSYDDIKYIIVKDNSDFKNLSETIVSLEVREQTKYELISKIIVWNNSKGDF